MRWVVKHVWYVSENIEKKHKLIKKYVHGDEFSICTFIFVSNLSSDSFLFQRKLENQ